MVRTPTQCRWSIVVLGGRGLSRWAGYDRCVVTVNVCAGVQRRGHFLAGRTLLPDCCACEVVQGGTVALPLRLAEQWGRAARGGIGRRES